MLGFQMVSQARMHAYPQLLFPPHCPSLDWSTDHMQTTCGMADNDSRGLQLALPHGEHCTCIRTHSLTNHAGTIKPTTPLTCTRMHTPWSSTSWKKRWGSITIEVPSRNFTRGSCGLVWTHLQSRRQHGPRLQ
jgi:hypothetical protein